MKCKFMKMRKEYVRDVVKIHKESLPTDFLPQLGNKFLEEFYKASARSKYGTTFIMLINKKVAGFVTIAIDANRFYKELLKENFGAFFSRALPKIISKPKLLRYSFETFLSVLTEKPDRIPAEIVFIAISKEFRGKGLGKELVKQTIEYLKSKRIKVCKTKVEASNEAANDMYKKLGFKIRNKFRVTGKEWVWQILEHGKLKF